MYSDTPHQKYLSYAQATVGLRGKTVLEVGGSTPPGFLQEYGVKAWDCVNLNSQAVADFNRQRDELKLANFTAIAFDATKFQPQKQYDVVYSINAFEHIRPLPGAFEVIQAALRPGGRVFTLFGPIWSCDVGHHLSIRTEKGELMHFQDGVLEPWEHMTGKREAIHAKLKARFGEEAAERAVDFIYDYPDLNRLCERDYFRILDDARQLSRILVVKNKKGAPPPHDGASATRELMFVLKKGKANPIETAVCFVKFALAYAKQRLA